MLFLRNILNKSFLFCNRLHKHLIFVKVLKNKHSVNILKQLLYLLLLLLVGFACVPRKKLIYLQEDQRQPIRNFQSKDESYRLKPEDIISVNIFSLTPGQFDIFGSRSGGEGSESSAGSNVNLFTIDDEGFVELPAIGELEVSGLTIKEAQDKIRLELEDYLQSPLVRITLQTPFEFTVLGEVNGPGRYTVIGKELTLLEAIGTAGDLTQYADRSQLKIVRRNEDGTSNITYVNVLNDDLLASENYYLRSEDLIIVDPLRAKSVRENQLFLISSLIGTLSTITLLIWNLNRINQ